MALRLKKAALIILLTSIVLLLAIYFWRDDAANTSISISNAKTIRDVGNAPSFEEQPDKKLASTKSSNRSRPAYALPSSEKPFDETFAELKSASEKGEAKAACLLSIELIRCQVMSTIDEKLVNQMVNQPHADGMTEAEKLAFDQFNLVQYQAFMACKKIPPEVVSNAVGYLEKAARLKQVDAMVLWASGGWIRNWRDHNDADLQDPVVLRWQASATPLMTEALKAGSYGAALEWLLAYRSDRSTPFSRLVKDDPKQAYTFSVLIKLLENSDVAPRQRPGLSARDSLEAEQKARQMFEKWFNRKPPTIGISSSNFGPGVEACGPLAN